MPKVTPISLRKIDHIRINLEKDVNSGLSTGLEHYHFVHEALPEINLVDIDPAISIFNHRLEFPLLISSMTGGTDEAFQINRNLAIAAQETKIAMGLGSMRAALDQPEFAYTFAMRKWAPDVLLFANIGAIQLNYGYGVDQCRKAIEMSEADALFLHLNPLQEALQLNGNTRFSGLLEKIENICSNLAVPVIVKEVGWGISAKTARRLFNAGVSAIDVSGAGGTSWSQVEMHRSENPNHARLAAGFINWGIPTAESIIQVHQEIPEAIIFASGGLRSGIDIAKCLALGASLGGMAAPFLKAAALSVEKSIEEISLTKQELLLVMFVTGCKNISDLQHTHIVAP